MRTRVVRFMAAGLVLLAMAAGFLTWWSHITHVTVTAEGRQSFPPVSAQP